MSKAKLTKAFIESLPPHHKQTLYWDTELPGFGVCVGVKSKTYIVQRDIKGRPTRCTIGKHGLYFPETARKKAQKILLDMADGINPNVEKAREKIRGITLIELYSQYHKDRAIRRAEGTFVNYQDFMDNQFGDWKNKPIIEISKDMVIERHQKITEDSGPYAANSSIQFLRALYNYAKIDNDDLRNPVDVMSQKKLWHESKRRTSIIRDNQLPEWYAAVMNLQNQTMKDALRFLLFTGLRRMEAFKLRWEYVDLESKTFKIPHTKNGLPLELPMSDFLYDLLNTRKKNAGDNPWVFPGNGKSGHLTEPKKALVQIKNDTGITFMAHDLRRTFITIAERLEISSYALKHLVNHKTKSDVTSGYIIMNTERLRIPMQKIADELQKLIVRG